MGEARGCVSENRHQPQPRNEQRHSGSEYTDRRSRSLARRGLQFHGFIRHTTVRVRSSAVAPMVRSGCPRVCPISRSVRQGCVVHHHTFPVGEHPCANDRRTSCVSRSFQFGSMRGVAEYWPLARAQGVIGLSQRKGRNRAKSPSVEQSVRWRNGPALPLARFGTMGGALARGRALRPGGRPSN